MANTIASWISLSFIKLSCTASCFLTFSWIMRSVLLMLRWVELLAVFAKRFMGASTWNTFPDSLHTFAMVMAFFSAFPTYLCFVALVCFVVSDFLAVVALLWVISVFKCLRASRLPSSIKEPFSKESLHVQPFVEVYH